MSNKDEDKKSIQEILKSGIETDLKISIISRDPHTVIVSRLDDEKEQVMLIDCTTSFTENGVHITGYMEMGAHGYYKRVTFVAAGK